MKATWIGEEGAGDEIVHHGIRFKAGRAVEVPEEIGIGRLFGNPFFKLDKLPKQVDANAERASAVKQLEEDVARAENDLSNARKDEDREAAQGRLNDARQRLAEARG